MHLVWLPQNTTYKNNLYHLTATPIPPLSQPVPPTPIAETTNASLSPTPSPAHELMEHTFEQPSSDRQPHTPRQEATTSQLMTRIDDLEKQLKETKQTFGKAILTLEETEAQGRKFHDLDPLVSLLQELVTPSKTVNASGEEQVEDISPTTLEAAAILTKVKKIKSVDKGKRYKRRKSSKESALVTGLDFEESYGLLLKEVNTGGIKVSAGIEEINTGSLDVNTGIDPITTDSIRVSIPSLDRGRREGKAPMTKEEETHASRKTKEQILQEEAGLVEAIRLDALEKAMEKERIWPNIRLFGFNSSSKSKLEANAELKKSVLGNDLTVKDYAKRMVELLISIDEVGIFEDSKEDFGKIGLPTVPYELLKLTKERTQLQRKGLKKTKDDEPNQGRLERGEQIGKERIPLHTYDKDDI
ncbi:hypothetical protein Tco_1409014 [Tanacetum coccineum]